MTEGCGCSGTTITYTSGFPPSCFKSKCDGCFYKDKCANADKASYPYIPTTAPYYPLITYSITNNYTG